MPDNTLVLSLSDMPAKEELNLGRVRWTGARVGPGQRVSIDGRFFEGLDGAFITADGGRAVIVLDNIAKSIQIDDIVKLRSRMYVVMDIVPAGQNVSRAWQGKGVSTRPEKRQTYILAYDGKFVRVPASEISGIVSRGGA